MPDKKRLPDLFDGVPDLRGRRVVVIGAGASGLACAYHLKKRGVEVEVIERSAQAGGLARSALLEDRYIVDFGPSAFQAGSERLVSLARELSIDKLIVGEPHSKLRMGIFRRGKVHPIPKSRMASLLTPLVPIGAKAKLISRPLAKRGVVGTESLADYVRLRMGDDVLANLVDPIASWVAGGDSELLEAASSLGWMMKDSGTLHSLGGRKISHGAGSGQLSFRWGMGTMAARMEELLKGKISFENGCSSIEMKGGGGFILGLSDSSKLLSADAVVVATQSSDAASLLGAFSDEMTRSLGEIEYSPMLIAHMAFKSSDIDFDEKVGTIIVPRGSGMRILGVTFTSRLFPGRCPSGQEMVSVTMGGVGDEASLLLSDDEVMEEVRGGLEELTGVSARPRFKNVRRVPQAIPQYAIGHRRRLADIKGAIAQSPGIFLTGNYFSGISLSDTIEHAWHTADEVVDFLRTM